MSEKMEPGKVKFYGYSKMNYHLSTVSSSIYFSRDFAASWTFSSSCVVSCLMTSVIPEFTSSSRRLSENVLRTFGTLAKNYDILQYVNTAQ